MGDSRLEPLVLSEAERRVENRVRRRTAAHGLPLRARIALACAEGGPNLAVATRLGVNRGTVAKWRRLSSPLAGDWKRQPAPRAPRLGRPPSCEA
ncbi:helix-turn-helix domain-containing protein [Streptomyces sp. NPDC005329]|uniref:helix-turn-helix domain-containing protein n=1 Tax=Streptomyces sp. NPDC005329 TaxID=3157034 RepID=UPI0033A7A5D2